MGDKEATEQRRRNERKEYLQQWKVDATKRAVAVRENQKRTMGREKKLREKEDIRLRKFRETQFLDTMRERGRSFSPKAGQEPSGEAEEIGDKPSSPTPSEAAVLSKSFEQQERARRHAERAERRKQEEAKKSKVDKLGAQNPNATEILRINEWRRQEESKKQVMEKARLQRELADEKAIKETAQRVAEREEKFEVLESRRNEANLQREARRNEAVTQRIKNVSIGTGLPMALVY